jgi:hypothetical protein
MSHADRATELTVREANAAALARLVDAQPVLVDCVPAREALGLPERTVLHAGPPRRGACCPPVHRRAVRHPLRGLGCG